jgi:hypothetical protein
MCVLKSKRSLKKLNLSPFKTYPFVVTTICCVSLLCCGHKRCSLFLQKLTLVQKRLYINTVFEQDIARFLDGSLMFLLRLIAFEFGCFCFEFYNTLAEFIFI